MLTKEEKLALKLLEIWAMKQESLTYDDVVDAYKFIKNRILENGYDY